MVRWRSKCIFLFAALISALAWAEGPARAAVIEDFEQPTTLFVHQGEARGGAYSEDPAPQGGGKVGKLSWKDEHARFLELHYRNPRPLPIFDKGLDGTVSVRVYSEAGSAARGVSLRLVDARNEVFQWGAPADLNRTGWTDVTFTVKPETSNGSWGGIKDGKVDLPVRLLGFALNFHDKRPGAGSILLDDVRAAGAGQRVDTSRALWRFDAGESWRIAGDPNKLVRWQVQEKGTLLTCAPTNKEQVAYLIERGFSTMKARDYNRVSLRCELLSGKGASFMLRVRDANGEIHGFQRRELKPGLNELTWQIPADKTGGTHGENLDGKIDTPILLHELLFRRDPGSDEVAVRLLSGEIGEEMSALEAVQVEVETGNSIRVLKAGEEGKLALRLRNTALEPAQFRAAVQLENYAGETISYERDFRMEPQAEVMWPLPAPKQMGIWWVHYAFRDPDGNAEARGKRSFVSMKPAGPTPGKANGFLFSICTHTERWSRQDAEREIMAAGLCGAKVIRTGVTWEGLQPAEGVFNWDHMDWLVDSYEKQGMEIQKLLGYCPLWAVADPEAAKKGWRYAKGQCPRMDAWRAYVSACAKRYNGRIRYWEVWNEPDIGFWTGTLDEYLQILQAAHEEIKKVNPQMQVMTGGFAIYERNPSFIEGVIDRGQAWFDIFAHHRHGNFEAFHREVDGPIARLRGKLNPPRPIYFNETAFSSTDEHYQADTLFKKLTFAWSRGSMGYTWYDLRNDGYNPKDGEHNYGLLTHDFYPKAAYPVYNTLALHLTGKQYQRQFDLGADRWAFLFADGREQIITAWNELSGGEEHLVVRTDARQAFRMDIMGNQEPLPIVDGRVVLALSGRPGYLVLKGGKRTPEMEGSLVAFRGPNVAVPGRSLTVGVELLNPSPKERRVQLNWQVPERLGGGSKEQALVIPAGARKVATLPLTVPEGTSTRYGDVYSLAMTYRMEGTPWTGTVPVPVHMAAYIPAGTAQRPADFRLDTRAQVYNLFENDPHSVAYLWKGPEDLSAQVWLGRTAAGMTMRVAVRDDVHCQEFSGAETWRGDGIQMAFQIPGQDGFWELGLARLKDGSNDVYTWSRPKGFADPTGKVQLRTTPQPGGMLYEAVFPAAAFGLDAKALEQGIRFNLIVNDNDGDKREGWVQISNGIGQSKDPTLFPFVVFASEKQK